MFCSVGLLQVRQLKVLVSNYDIAGAVEPCRTPVVHLQQEAQLETCTNIPPQNTLQCQANLEISKLVVAQFVHKTVEKCWGSFCIHTELAPICEVVTLLQHK